MTLNEALKQLKALANEKVRAHNTRSGAGDDQFGVSLGDIRVLAKKIGTDHPLALSLWETGNVDARFLATLLIQPKKLSAKEMDGMVRSLTFVRVAVDVRHLAPHRRNRRALTTADAKGVEERTSAVKSER